MVNKCLVVFLLSFSVISFTSFAKGSGQADTHKTALIAAESLLSDWKQRLIEDALASKQYLLAETIKQTSINITSEIKLPSVAYALHESNRQIVIAEEYVIAVNEFAPFFNRFVHDDREREFNGQTHLSFEDIALLDVLFHEMGHHAMDAMYASRSSPYRIARAEQEAEYWSIQQKKAYDLDRYQLGRIISLFSIVAYQSNKPRFYDEENEWQRSMLDNSVYRACKMANSLIASNICDEIRVDNHYDTASISFEFLEQTKAQ